MAAIARAAGLSTSNIYVYFSSKLAVVFAIFEPWITAEIERVLAEAGSRESPAERLDLILGAIWQEIPEARNNFLNVFIEALSTTSEEHGYTPKVLRGMRDKIRAAIGATVPPERSAAIDIDSIAHIIVMAFDGFVINAHLTPGSRCSDAMIAAMRDLILGGGGAIAGAGEER